MATAAEGKATPRKRENHVLLRGVYVTPVTLENYSILAARNGMSLGEYLGWLLDYTGIRVKAEPMRYKN